METKNQLTLGTLYEANKRLMSNKEIFKPMNVLEIGGAQAKIENFFNMKCDCYAMLYCRERSDITDGNFEIWIRIEEEPYAYYLFPYDNAVIEV